MSRRSILILTTLLAILSFASALYRTDYSQTDCKGDSRATVFPSGCNPGSTVDSIGSKTSCSKGEKLKTTAYEKQDCSGKSATTTLDTVAEACTNSGSASYEFMCGSFTKPTNPVSVALYVKSDCSINPSQYYYLSNDVCTYRGTNTYHKVTCSSGKVTFQTYSDSNCTTTKGVAALSADDKTCTGYSSDTSYPYRRFDCSLAATQVVSAVVVLVSVAAVVLAF